MTARPIRAPQAADYAGLLVLGATWGASFMFTKVAVADLAPQVAPRTKSPA